MLTLHYASGDSFYNDFVNYYHRDWKELLLSYFILGEYRSQHSKKLERIMGATTSSRGDETGIVVVPEFLWQ